VSSGRAVPDYYAVLQVQPDADDEVIAAAYRQLMKKYHPDHAGSDPARVVEHAARATALNEAFSVLRDPQRRRHYDSARIFFGTPPPRAEPAAPPESASRPPAQPVTHAQPVNQSQPVIVEADLGLPAPLAWLRALYYLLPGAYEWEKGQNQELFTVFTLFVVTVLSYAFMSGRLAPWIGTTLQAQIVMLGLLLLLSLPLIWSLLRVVLAIGPTALVLTGIATPTLAQAHVPSWLAWPIAALISLMLSARLYVFGVVPALLCCWALSALT
jgi:DnaJ-like protein